jgi:hypothetical protein
MPFWLSPRKYFRGEVLFEALEHGLYLPSVLVDINLKSIVLYL